MERRKVLLGLAAAIAALGTILLILGGVSNQRGWKIEQEGPCLVLTNDNGAPVDMECP